MIRRYPVATGLLGLLLAVALYVTTSPALGRTANEWWYRSVDRRLTVDKATLMPPPARRWFGMYRPELPWDYVRFFAVGEALGVAPKIVAWYQAWGQGVDHEFKSDAVSRIHAKGLWPLITWEPWLSDFGRRSVSRPEGSLVPIVNGDFDDYIRAWARAVVRSHRPVYIRPLHEMGNAAYSWSTAYPNNTPEVLVQAWRHVVGIFRAEGARNAAFVWTPFTPDDRECWPGDDWVDWVGLDILNYGMLAEGGQWEEFRPSLQWQLDSVRAFRKPIMVAEVGCSGFGGNCQDWWVDTFKDLSDRTFSDVKAVVIYDNPAFTSTSSTATVDWGFSHIPQVLPMLQPWARSAGLVREDGDGKAK